MMKIAITISIIIIITAIMMIIIMIIMIMTIMIIIIKMMTVMIKIMIIIIIQSIYNEIKARSNKIPKVEKTAKSSILQPFEKNFEKPMILILIQVIMMVFVIIPLLLKK